MFGNIEAFHKLFVTMQQQKYWVELLKNNAQGTINNASGNFSENMTEKAENSLNL